MNLRRFKTLLLHTKGARKAVARLIAGEKVDQRIHLGDAIFVTVETPYRCV